MRLQLRRAALLALLLALPARAEDRVSIRGVYYREASTKVVQPLVQATKDLPEGFDVSAHGLIDAITSPSELEGFTGDEIGTEYRKEAGFVIGKTIGRDRVGLSYKLSREPDYVSNAFGFQFTRGIWDNSGTIGLNVAYSTDQIGPNLDLGLQSYFASLAYTQALSPTLLAEVSYEATLQHGYLCNVYSLDKYGRGRDTCPPRRLRHVAVARIARYFPEAAAGVQLHYRFYYDEWPGSLAAQPGASDLHAAPSDPWHMLAHTIEGRVYREMGHGVELRLSYRFHTQGQARFSYCSDGDPSMLPPGCEGVPVAAEHASDEKLTAFSTHVLEGKIYWDARVLAGVPLLAWFALGTFELSYGRYFQPTHYGDAHVLQTGYSLPF